MSITVTTSIRAIPIRLVKGRRTLMKSVVVKKLGSDLTLRRL